MINLHGLHTKTIIIPTKKNVYKYKLGDYQTYPIGENVKIIAISARVNPFFLSNIAHSKEDRPLINQFEAAKGYLSLVAGKNNNIAYEKSLYTIIRDHNANFGWNVNPSYDIFIPPCDSINWTKSELVFDSDINFDGTKDIELNVLYQAKDATPPKKTLQFYNGADYINTKQRTVQVNTKQGKISFSFCDENPINDHDYIIGLRVLDYSFTTKDSQQGINRYNFLGSSFLNLMAGTAYLLKDYPLMELQPLQNTNIPYFPVHPTRADKIDWAASKIELSDKSRSLDNHAYLITLYYQ